MKNGGGLEKNHLYDEWGDWYVYIFTRLQMYAHLYVRVWKRATGRHRTSTSPTSTGRAAKPASLLVSFSLFLFFYFGHVIAEDRKSVGRERVSDVV